LRLFVFCRLLEAAGVDYLGVRGVDNVYVLARFGGGVIAVAEGVTIANTAHILPVFAIIATFAGGGLAFVDWVYCQF